MVHTKDGSVFYGELVEKVVHNHVTIILASGVVKTIAWRDIDDAPLAMAMHPPLEPPLPLPVETIRTKNGSVYRGVVIEKVAGDHVSIKLETGAIKSIDEADIDPAPPSRVAPQYVPQDPAPKASLHMKDGGLYHGEIVETVMRDHVTLKLATGDVKTFDWEDIQWEVPPPPPPPPRVVKADVELTFAANDASAVLQRRTVDRDGYDDFCASPCHRLVKPEGIYRVNVPGTLTTNAFQLRSAHDNHIVASIRPHTRMTIGTILAIAAIPIQAIGAGLAVATSNAPTYTISNLPPYYYLPVDNTALSVASVAVNVLAPLVLAVGLILMAESTTSVKLNDVRVARFGIDGLHF
jgi:hypothetical protein